MGLRDEGARMSTLSQFMDMMASGGAGGAGYASAVAVDAPLLWYRMNGTAVNGATEANLGSYTSAGASPNGVYSLSTTDRPLQPGSSLVAGDTSSLRTTTSNSYLQGGGESGGSLGLTNQYGVEAWFSAGSSAGYQGLAALDNSVRTFQLRINPSGKLELVHINGAIVTIASTATVTGNGRHQAAATLAPGGILSLYLDGAQVATSTNAALVAAAKNNMYIGNYNGSGNQLLGNVAEVSLYGTALTSARILAHWNAGK
jgi:hypothetical protein